MQDWESLIAERTEAHGTVKTCLVEDPVKRNRRNLDRLCEKVPKTPEEMDVPELKKLLDICNQMQGVCGWNEETYNQQLWIDEAKKVENLIK